MITDEHVSANLLAVGQGLYAFNRFLASGFITIGIKPRYILAVYLGLSFVFGLCATLTHGPASVAMLILVLCFESVSADLNHISCAVVEYANNDVKACFATIFTLALRGLGIHTKRGGSMLVAAISGGAAIPPMTGAVATRTGNFHTAMAIPTAFFVLAWVFPVYANFVSKDLLDGHRKSDLNVSSSRVINKEMPPENITPRASKAGVETSETVPV
jgi:FHS family L-fucose permease-like MFS transporter